MNGTFLGILRLTFLSLLMSMLLLAGAFVVDTPELQFVILLGFLLWFDINGCCLPESIIKTTSIAAV